MTGRPLCIVEETVTWNTELQRYILTKRRKPGESIVAVCVHSSKPPIHIYMMCEGSSRRVNRILPWHEL